MCQLIPLLILTLHATAASAGEAAFSKGPVFKDFGPVANFDVTFPVDPDTVLKHSFDGSAPAAASEPNPALVSAARC